MMQHDSEILFKSAEHLEILMVDTKKAILNFINNAKDEFFYTADVLANVLEERKLYPRHVTLSTVQHCIDEGFLRVFTSQGHLEIVNSKYLNYNFGKEKRAVRQSFQNARSRYERETQRFSDTDGVILGYRVLLPFEEKGKTIPLAVVLIIDGHFIGSTLFFSQPDSFHIMQTNRRQLVRAICGKLEKQNGHQYKSQVKRELSRIRKLIDTYFGDTNWTERMARKKWHIYNMSIHNKYFNHVIDLTKDTHYDIYGSDSIRFANQRTKEEGTRSRDRYKNFYSIR